MRALMPFPEELSKELIYFTNSYRAAHENRTHDLRFTRATLYRLS